MPVVQSVDYLTRRIYLGAMSVGVPLDLLDVYREVRALRATTPAHRKHPPMVVAGGNIRKTATTYTQPYVQLLYGCHIVPFNVPQTLVVVREVFGDDGRSGVACFDRSAMTGIVDIDMQVSPVEVREVNTSGAAAGLTAIQAQQLDRVLKLASLIPALIQPPSNNCKP